MTKLFQPTDHFLPDYHHWHNVSIRVEEAITVPIRRVPHVAQWTGDPPFLVYTCSWFHLNEYGPLTEDKFQADLTGAIKDLSNGLNQYEEFLAYPITYNAPTTIGRAYHDWIGASYPFDLRSIIDYDTNIQLPNDPEVYAGLKFHLVTLISSEVVERAN